MRGRMLARGGLAAVLSLLLCSMPVPVDALKIDAVKARIMAAEQGDQPVKRILLLGNSYIALNDLPDLFERVAAMHPDNTDRYVTVTVVAGGALLIDHLQKEDVRQALTDIRWDFVVLQEQSTAPLIDLQRRAFLKAVQVVSDVTKDKGTKIVLVATWPRKPGSDFYKMPATAAFTPPRTPQEMNEIVETANIEAARATDAVVARIGSCWLRAPSPEFLYLTDGSHPGIAGTYLTVLVLYKAISGNSPLRVNYAPYTINKWNATMLKDLAEGC